MIDIDWTDIDQGLKGSNTITASGLTEGVTYYLHFDDHGGAECDHEIGSTSYTCSKRTVFTLPLIFVFKPIMII